MTVVLGHARLVWVENDPPPIVSVDGVRHLSQAVGILGSHAVWLFFVLSGLVLARMMLGARGFDYGNYVLGRMARLYLPVAGAVVLAYATVLAVPRTEAGLGQWVDNHPDSYSPSSVIYDLALIAGPSGSISPLWSLRWEVLFSLLLIVYVATLGHVKPWVGIAGGVVAVAAGQVVANPVLLYMSMFAVGVSLAFVWDRLDEAWRRYEARASMPVYYLGALGLFGLAYVAQLLAMVPGVDVSSRAVQAAVTLVAMAAITASIVLVGLATPLRDIFDSRVMRWLGLVSFSLYLIHEPVLLAFVYATRADPAWLLAGLVLCFPVAHLFYRLVERPSHRVAQKIGKRGLDRQAEGQAAHVTR